MPWRRAAAPPGGPQLAPARRRTGPARPVRSRLPPDGGRRRSRPARAAPHTPTTADASVSFYLLNSPPAAVPADRGTRVSLRVRGGQRERQRLAVAPRP